MVTGMRYSKKLQAKTGVGLALYAVRTGIVDI